MQQIWVPNFFVVLKTRVSLSLFKDYPRTGGSVGWASGCYAGGREFNSGWTNTQGLKITANG